MDLEIEIFNNKKVFNTEEIHEVNRVVYNRELDEYFLVIYNDCNGINDITYALLSLKTGCVEAEYDSLLDMNYYEKHNEQINSVLKINKN